MGKINILDKHVAELIAAGEVVERPASVIKELVENSIDAGATAVTIEIKNGGITYIRVSDNGAGIAKDDVPKAFLRHATSKVRLEDDLDHISTLGFRGEALASISAVSHVELLTCGADEQVGTKYAINGGEEQASEDAGCPKGTTIVVRDLFYNVPARMKFLKKDVSEANAVANIMDKIALSHPEIAITFIRDGKQALKTTGDGKLHSAIYSVYGREFANGLMSVDYTLNGVTVRGFISRPQNARPNRSMQNFFINGRFIKSRTAMAAVEEACKGSVMTGKFPACVLHITLSCEAVDVNVHPAKIEVRFVNERPIFDAVYHAVKSALMEKDRIKEISLTPQTAVQKKSASPFTIQDTQSFPAEKAEDLQKGRLSERPQASRQNNAGAKTIQTDTTAEEPQISVPKARNFQNSVADSANPFDLYKGLIRVPKHMAPVKEQSAQAQEHTPKETLQAALKTSQKQPQENPQAEARNALTQVQETDSTRFIGEAFRTYIIIERSKDELMLIDKHAAHERMIYERLKKEKGRGSTQYLLEPVAVTLNKLEYDAVLQSTDLLNSAGFEVEDFGAGTVLVRSAPQYLENTDIADTVMEMAGYLLANKNDINAAHMDWIYHNVACRAAIKAGNDSHPQELIELARRLEQEKDLRYCPHGRPVSIIIKKREIEKQFGRV